MAGLETASGPNIDFLQKRYKEFGHYVTHVQVDAKTILPDGAKELRLGHNGKHSINGADAEHTFIYDPTKIEVVSENVEPRNKANELRNLCSKGYTPLYTPDYSRLAAYRTLPQESTQ